MQGFSIGDEVFGMVRFPSYGESAAYAEYVAAPASDLAFKSAGIDHIHAAGAPMSGLTAWQFLIELGHSEPNPLQPELHRPVPLDGKRVLVNGAAGGVGHFGVQLAKWKGAHVIAVASGANESFLHEPDLDTQIQLAFVNLQEVLAAADCTFDDVVDLTFFLIDPEASVALMIDAMKKAFLSEPMPNVTAVGVNWLAGFQFEVKVIARIPPRSIGLPPNDEIA